MESKTLIHNVIEKTKKHPERAFLHQPVNRQWQVFTWQDVEHQARCIAAGLRAKGYKQGDRIGILSKNCAQWFIADIAIAMAGMISVPIFSTAGEKTIRHSIAHSDMKAIFVGKLDDLKYAQAAIDDQLLSIAFPYPTISTDESWDDWLEQYPPLEDVYKPTSEDIYTIVYTSGSTGLPKGVVIRHRHIAAAVPATAAQLDSSENDRMMSYLPLAHITERAIVENVAYEVAGKIFFVESLDTFIDDVKYAKPTAFVSVPRLWLKFQSKILEKLPPRKLNRLLSIPIIKQLVSYKIRKSLGLQHASRFGSGTAPIPVSVLQWYEKIGIPIGEGWGMSETTGLSCSNSPFDPKLFGSIGRPLDCVEMRLSDEGEVQIRGEAVFEEYYRDEETTRASFEDGWFKTGDLGQVDGNGVFKIVGRIKEQFKTSKGKYVAPVPIESAFGECAAIEQICVMGTNLKQPVALVVLAEHCEHGDKALQKELQLALATVNGNLESHERLDFLLICEEPWTVENEALTPTLKLKRNVIEGRYQSLVEQSLQGSVLWEADVKRV